VAVTGRFHDLIVIRGSRCPLGERDVTDARTLQKSVEPPHSWLVRSAESVIEEGNRRSARHVKTMISITIC
jgi:hypothetical protein